MNKILLLTNIKGGVGKTSCCALFAQYLCENGFPVKVLDADIQASLSRHRERELAANPDAVIPWEVSTVDTTDRQSLQSSIKEAMEARACSPPSRRRWSSTVLFSSTCREPSMPPTSTCCTRQQTSPWCLSPTTSTPSMPLVSSSRSSSA